MKKMMEATEYANPGQTPVLAADSPIYRALKKLQRLYPDEVGEKKLVLFLGLLHFEMMKQEVGGKLMGGSGWAQMFAEAGIFTPGVCNSLTGGKYVKRTREAYEITLIWNEIQKDFAYSDYCNSQPAPHSSKEEWLQKLVNECPTIHYWNTIENFLLNYFRLIRGQRSGDWPLTLSSIDNDLGWIFAFDRNSYSRLTPTFLLDMSKLPDLHPDVHQAFMSGLFGVQRSNKKFSVMSLDQSHEHSIKYVKEDGGSRGNYQDKFEKEMLEVSRPEILRAVHEFEEVLGKFWRTILLYQFF